MKRVFMNPMAQFFVLGALFFGIHASLNRENSAVQNASQRVVIGPGEVQWLTETWVRQWQREPTPEELRGLVTDLLREQLLALEAKELGLDENDTIVRRRLAQKLEFLIQDTAQFSEPTEEELRRFYEANPERFMEPARISFEHIYFSPDQRSNPDADARAALAAFAGDATATPSLFGDRLMIETEFEDADEQFVSNQFGARFAQSVFALEPGDWQGPIESGYGLHLVRISRMTPRHAMAFEEVRDRVQAGWLDQRQREANERYLEALFEKYEVVVDKTVRPIIGSLDAPSGALE